MTPKRLHDPGRSAWAMAWPVSAFTLLIVFGTLSLFFVLGPDAMDVDGTGFWIRLALAVSAIDGCTTLAALQKW